MGCEVDLKFPTVKLLDYRQDWDSLEQSHNPFAIIIMAHLHTQATRHQPDERYALKWTLTRRLYEQGYTKRDVQLLFRFIDWLMALPPELKRHFERTITEYEEARKMTFITSIEEIGIEKGIKQGIEQGILQKAREAVIEVLEIRFEDVPETLVEAINTLDDADILKTLHKQAVLVESIEHFTQDMDNLLADKSDQDQAPS